MCPKDKAADSIKHVSWKALQSEQDKKEYRESQSDIKKAANALEQKLRIDLKTLQEPYTV